MELIPPAEVAKVAAAALQMRDEQPDSNKCCTPTGLKRANQLKNRESLSPRTIRRMVNYFTRHEIDKEADGFRKGEPGFPSKGRQAWDMWGGDPGRAWAEEMLKKLESDKQESLQPSAERGVTNMIDVKVLTGADIRRIDGKYGKISKLSLPWVTVQWSDGKTESFLRSDDALSEDIELKTLDKGWISLGSVVGKLKEQTVPAVESAQEDGLGAALEELQSLRRPARLAEVKERLLEAAKKKKKRKHYSSNPHNPFYNYKTLGLQSPKKVKRSQKNRWKCKQQGDVQVCVAQVDIPDQGIKKGAKKTVRPWAGMAAYTANYEKGRKSGKYKPGNAKETEPVRHRWYFPPGSQPE